jgi:hypothetical protein
VQRAFELSTEMKEGVREAKLSRATPAFRFGIWINLTTKGGRMRSIPYSDLEMTVDIPKPIAVQLVAVRILHFVRLHDCVAHGYALYRAVSLLVW